MPQMRHNQPPQYTHNQSATRKHIAYERTETKITTLPEAAATRGAQRTYRNLGNGQLDEMLNNNKKSKCTASYAHEQGSQNANHVTKLEMSYARPDGAVDQDRNSCMTNETTMTSA